MVDLSSGDIGLVIRKIKESTAMAIDTIEMKLYFGSNQSIFSTYMNGTDLKIIIENANAQKMAFDWIGRRIFWTEYWTNRVSVANLDGQERRVLSNAIMNSGGIGVDATTG